MATRNFRHAKEALASARASYDVFAGQATFAQVDEHWRKFLRDIQRAWSKIEATCADHPAFRAIRDEHRRAEREDPLIKYLNAARNSDEHSIRELTSVHSQSTISPLPGTNYVHIEHAEFDNGRVISFKGTGMVMSSSRIALLPAVNRGVTFPVPTTHRGAPINAVAGEHSS